jgi:hypothetical protein
MGLTAAVTISGIELAAKIRKHRFKAGYFVKRLNSVGHTVMLQPTAISV